MPTDSIAVVDVETTGLYFSRDRVIEVAVVIMDRDGTIRHEYETLVNPERDLGPTSIHGISAAEVLDAPRFPDIAGDLLELMAEMQVIAGHNVVFDRNFLRAEYERAGAALPDFPALCTCNAFGRSSLEACCRELGIEVDGRAHRAITDARATADLVRFLLENDGRVLETCRLHDIRWPALPPQRTPPRSRDAANQRADNEPTFLQRAVQRLRHDGEATTSEQLAYLTLLDRVLEDRVIDPEEHDLLVETAAKLNVTRSQLDSIHDQYIQNLVIAALADNIVTDAERRDLQMVTRLLGREVAQTDQWLEQTSGVLDTVARDLHQQASVENLTGQRVCFTGDLQCTIGQSRITRQMAELLAETAGLVPVGSVTKKLDVLVCADPHTQSGKAKKAREYGIRIIAEPVFWRRIGVNID